MRAIATIISRIFDPFAMLTLSLIVALWGRSSLVAVIIFMALGPFILFYLAWKMRLIDDWDIRDRRQRPKVLWVLIAVECVGMIVFQLPQLISFLIVLVGFTLITHRWKISGHMLGVSLLVWTIIGRYGWILWPVMVMLPLVAWARVARGDHTISQVIAGALYPFGVLWLYEIGQSFFRYY